VSVSSINILHENLGTAARLCLRVRHEGANGLPEIMWLKTGFPSAHLDQMLETGIYSREAKFYAELKPQLRLRVPDCYGAVYDQDSGRGIVLLENLDRSDVTIFRCVTPLSVDASVSGLDLLANLHGSSWQQDWLYSGNIQKFLARGTSIETHLRSFPIDYLESVFDGPLRDLVPPEARGGQRAYDALWRIQDHYDQEPFCLIHADVHPGNSYIVDGQGVGLFDWQTYSMGPWAHDFAYWMVGGLSVSDRRRYERDLLDGYLRELHRSGGATIDPAFAWDSYRQFIVFGYLIWLAVPSTMQPTENMLAMCERFGTAIADHKVFERLGLGY
jgi:hypothetical protein